MSSFLALTWAIWACTACSTLWPPSPSCFCAAGGPGLASGLWYRCLPAGLSLLALMLALVSAAEGFQSNLEAAESSLPLRLLILPVPAWRLAFPAFLTATVPPFLATALFTYFVIQPAEDRTRCSGQVCFWLPCRWSFWCRPGHRPDCRGCTSH